MMQIIPIHEELNDGSHQPYKGPYPQRGGDFECRGFDKMGLMVEV